MTTLDPNIKELLKDLHQMIHQVQNGRNKSEATILNIKKTHDNMKQQNKVNNYYKTKLKGLYETALTDAKSEAEQLSEAIAKIADIQNTKAKSGSASENKPAMRRGVLMSMIHKDAANLPLWEATTRYEKPPPLCGRLSADSNYIVPKGKYVAAKVKGSENEDNWILAEIVSYNNHTCKYDVDDIDSEDGRERHILSKKSIIALPLYRADPLLHNECLYFKGECILALYPQTTCFYKGVIHEQPRDAESGYMILFEDTSYPDGYSPPLRVPQRYVIPCTDSKPII